MSENDFTKLDIYKREPKAIGGNVYLINADSRKTTLDSASNSLKNQAGTFSELAATYGFTNDKRNRAFMPTSGSIISFHQSIPAYADKSFISNVFILAVILSKP